MYYQNVYSNLAHRLFTDFQYFLGCETYVESSSLTQDNLKEVFDNAIVEGLRSRQERARKKGKKKKKCTIL